MSPGICPAICPATYVQQHARRFALEPTCVLLNSIQVLDAKTLCYIFQIRGIVRLAQNGSLKTHHGRERHQPLLLQPRECLACFLPGTSSPTGRVPEGGLILMLSERCSAIVRSLPCHSEPRTIVPRTRVKISNIPSRCGNTSLRP